jgi:predicted nucleic acid-binding Zn ribbon protein
VLLLERNRSRRRDDALHVNLAILLLVLIAGLLFYYVG